MTAELSSYKWPRLFTPAPLQEGRIVTLENEQAHYLKNVMRLNIGDDVRLFNGQDGEWHGRIQTLDKKWAQMTMISNLRPQPPVRRAVHILFAPIKKARLDWLVEKAVELGATNLHPVITQQTDVRQINEDRMRAQIVEAAEQCERLDIPALHAPLPLKNKLALWPQDIPLLVGMERAQAPLLRQALPPTGAVAFLVGPEGGFSAEEREYPAQLPFLRPVSLGPAILRTETAACFMLSQALIGLE